MVQFQFIHTPVKENGEWSNEGDNYKFFIVSCVLAGKQ